MGACSETKQARPVSQKQALTYKPYSQKPETQPYATFPKPQSAASSPNIAAPEPRGGKAKVAILLPLSGPNATLGQSMLNAAQQAVFDMSDANFELQPKDTEAKGGAGEAAREAIVGNKAQLIIGPLFASDIPDVKKITKANGVLAFPLSTDTTLAERGVYVMGLAPAPQVERVVAYAAERKAKNFAALVPSTPYGFLVEGAFSDAVKQNGGNLVDVLYFDPNMPDEAAERIDVLAAQHDSIDALFLPVGDALLKTLAEQLAAAGFSPSRTHILGTGLWDIPDLGRQAPFLVGGWYAAPDPASRRRFQNDYKAAFNQDPPRLATLAYDATALAASLARRGGNFGESDLTNPNGFAGLDGIFRLKSSGIVERGLAVNEVTADGARIVDPSPTTFVSTYK